MRREAGLDPAIDRLLTLYDEARTAFAAAPDLALDATLRAAVGRDPLEIRRINLYGPAPRHTAPYGQEVAAAAASWAGPQRVCPDPPSAWEQARSWASPEDLVCVTGSFFIAARG